VPRRDGEKVRRKVTVDDTQVGVADAADAHLPQQIPGARFRHDDFLQYQRLPCPV
jgi:hypothetical protein